VHPYCSFVVWCCNWFLLPVNQTIGAEIQHFCVLVAKVWRVLILAFCIAVQLLKFYAEENGSWEEILYKFNMVSKLFCRQFVQGCSRKCFLWKGAISDKSQGDLCVKWWTCGACWSCKEKLRGPQARSAPAANVSPSTAAISAGVQETACSGFYKFDVKSLEMFEKCFWNGCLSIM